MNTPPRILWWTAGLISFAALTVLVHRYVSLNVYALMFPEEGTVRITDFIYHLIIVKAFWAGEITTIYGFEAQKAAIDAFFGREAHFVMPVAVTPTALVLWLPFVLAARVDVALASTLWVSASLALLAVGLVKSGAFLVARERGAFGILIVAMIIIMTSFLMQLAISLGQGSLMACGAMLLMFAEMMEAGKAGRPIRKWLVLPLVLLLSLKMPYAAAGIMLLLIFGYVYEAVLSAALLLLSVASLVLVFGPGLLTDWFAQCALYLEPGLPEGYIQLAFFRQSTFRAAYAPLLGDGAAAGISETVVIAGGLVSGLLALARHLHPRARTVLNERLTERQHAVAFFALLLLFLPYLGISEDLLLMVPFVIAHPVSGGGGGGGDRSFFNVKGAAVCICLFLILNYHLWHLYQYLWLLWFVKVGVLSYLYLAAGRAAGGPGEGGGGRPLAENRNRV
ncbi:MAG: hypothetical protein V3W31_09510 [Thermodesulfobacteriota bacterium]